MTRARNSANLASQGNLFVDIANDRTGIGSVVPAQNLHVAGTAGFHADTTFVGDLYNATWDRSDNSLKFVDNAKAKFGTSNDLEIYHDGTKSVIGDVGTGNLVINGTSIDIFNNDLGGAYAKFISNGAAELYHAGVKKLETTAYGTNTTGTAVNDGLVVAGVATVTTMNVTGVLTYEDVTSVDSVGFITARSGIKDSTLTSGRLVTAGTGGRLQDSAALTFDGSALSINSTGDQMLNLNSTDNGGTYIGYNRSGTRTAFLGHGGTGSTFTLRNEIANGNVQIVGLDGSSYVTMLQFDTGNSGNATFSGDVTISGNLSVTGTTTQNNSVSTSQKTITLASGAANNAAVDGAGIVIDAGSDTDKTLKWLDSTDRWTFTGGDVAANAFHGDGSNLTGISGVSIANQANDRLITATGTTDALNAEANLTMTGNILTFNTTANNHRIQNVATGNHYTELRFDSNRSGAGEALAFLNFRWDGDTVADIYAQTGSDTTNKDDGNLIFRTSPSQGSITERLRITSDGKVGLGRNDPAFALDIKSSGYSSLRLTNSSETGHGSHDVRIVGGGSNYQNIYFEASAFKFNTYNGSSVGERLRIASNGDVGVGNNNPDVNLHIGGGSEVTSPMVKLHRTNTYNNAWKFYQSHYASSDYGTLFIQPTLATTPNVEIVNSSGAMAMRVDSDTGVIKVKSGGGIEFSGGTPNSGSNPTVNSAILDDYEEGKFDPKFLENGTTEASYAWRYGQYVKVGGIVTVRLAFGLNGFNSSGGNFTTGWIGGMPYTHASPWGNSDFAYIQLIGYSYASGYGDSANTTQLSLELSQNADKFRVVQGQGKGNINQSSIGSGQRIAVTFQYPVA